MWRRGACVWFALALVLAAPASAFTPSADVFGPAPTERSRPVADDGSALPKEWTSPDRVVVGYQAGNPLALAVIESAADRLGADIVRIDGRLHFVVLDVSADARDALVGRLRQAAGVLYAKPDAIVKGHFEPNDPLYEDQWGPEAIGMPTAWDTSRGTHDRMVAVIDTGVRYTHADLAGNYCAASNDIDFVNADDDPMDDNGHGTHVAGTVAAAIDNGTGVAGMANVCLMAVKALDGFGFGSWADVASGIAHATANGADVISMSLGACPGCDPGEPMTSAVQYAWVNGVLNVASAGNASCDAVGYPAAYPEVIAVGSLDDPGTNRSSFSSCGPEVEVAAPGRDIVSTWSDGGYFTISGTSMAAPHVSGTAALVWSRDTSLTNANVRCILRGTADDLGVPGTDDEYGFGRLDSAEAIGLPAPSTGCSGLWPEPPPPPDDGFCSLPCSEDFDDGSVEHARTTGLWHVSKACAKAPSKPRYLGFNVDATCTYQTGLAESGAYTIWADTTGADVVALRFAHKHATEEVSPFDVMRVEASINGLTWSPVADFTGLPAAHWAAAALDVSTFAGGQVRFRFLFDTVDERDNAHLGWLIDDVRIEVPPPSPDLRVSDVSMSPAEPLEGTDTTFTATVTNAGEVGARASTTRFELDGTPLGDVATPALGPGEDATLDIGWTAAGPGTHELLVTADALADVAEDIREDNNTSMLEVGVVPPPCTLPCELDFDGAAPGALTANGLWHISDACAVPPSVPNYLGYNRDETCNYDTGATNAGEATLFVDLSDVPGAEVWFSHRHQSETFTGFDIKIVEISTDAGGSWDELDNFTGQVSTSWRRQRLDLTPYIGGAARLRWRFDTLDPGFNDYIGWLIDDIAVQVPPPPPPPCEGGNDNRSAPCVIAGLPFTNEQSTVGFGEEPGEVAPCAAESTAWYEYTHSALTPGQVTVDTVGSDFDTTLAVYRGSALLGCNDDAVGLTSSFTFTAQPGTTYQIQAGGWRGDTGNLVIGVRRPPLLGLVPLPPPL